MDDIETKKMLTDADHVRSLTMSDGWGIIYSKLQTRILDLQNISNLDMSKPETLPIQLASRKMAVDEIMVWLKSDVFGFVEQQENNSKKISPENINGYIDRN